MRRASTPVVSAAAELDQIATLAASDIEPAILDRVRELIDVTSERGEMDPTWCVIGMLGGTGAGKSSLVNALCGAQVVRAGMLRPTTNEACAASERTVRSPKYDSRIVCDSAADAPATPTSTPVTPPVIANALTMSETVTTLIPPARSRPVTREDSAWPRTICVTSPVHACAGLRARSRLA